MRRLGLARGPGAWALAYDPSLEAFDEVGDVGLDAADVGDLEGTVAKEGDRQLDVRVGADAGRGLEHHSGRPAFLDQFGGRVDLSLRLLCRLDTVQHVTVEQ